jgi:phage baseplate assembly protein W
MPRVVGVPNPGTVLQPGDRASQPVQNLRGRLAGDPIGRDLDPDGRPGVLIPGIQNLKNALERRLRTPRGYLPHHPQYGSGLHRYIGSMLALAEVLGARDEAARTLLDDPRVLGIVRLAVDVEGDAILINGAVETPLGEVEISTSVISSEG